MCSSPFLSLSLSLPSSSVKIVTTCCCLPHDLNRAKGHRMTRRPFLAALCQPSQCIIIAFFFHHEHHPLAFIHSLYCCRLFLLAESPSWVWFMVASNRVARRVLRGRQLGRGSHMHGNQLSYRIRSFVRSRCRSSPVSGCAAARERERAKRAPVTCMVLMSEGKTLQTAPR